MSEDADSSASSHIPCSTKTGESQKQERPGPQDDGTPTDPRACQSSAYLAEPSKHVESCSDTGLGAGSGDSDLIEDDRVWCRISWSMTGTVMIKSEAYNTNR